MQSQTTAEEYFFLEQFEHCFLYASIALLQFCNSSISPITILSTLSLSKNQSSTNKIFESKFKKNFQLNHSLILQYLRSVQSDATTSFLKSTSTITTLLLLLLKSSYLMHNRELLVTLLSSVLDQGNTMENTKPIREEFLLWTLQPNIPFYVDLVDQLILIWKKDINSDLLKQLETKIQTTLQSQVEQSTLDQLKQKERREKHQQAGFQSDFVEEYDYGLSQHEHDSHWPGTGYVSHDPKRITTSSSVASTSMNTSTKNSSEQLYKVVQFITKLVSQPVFWYSVIGSVCFLIGFLLPQDTKTSIKNHIVQFFSLAFSVQ